MQRRAALWSLRRRKVVGNEIKITGLSYQATRICWRSGRELSSLGNLGNLGNGNVPQGTFRFPKFPKGKHLGVGNVPQGTFQFPRERSPFPNKSQNILLDKILATAE